MHIWYPEFAGPSADEYEFALSQIALTEREKAMLRAHYYTLGGIGSAQQIAEAMGWSHYGVANIAVGTLGRKIATVLGVVSALPAVGRARRPELWTAYTSAESTPEGFMWTLRPNFVEALLKQPWMNP